MAVAKRNAGIALLALLACAAAEAATFAVDTTDDAVDAAIGDGLCARAGGGCTLRAAIQEANFDAAPDAIVLPAGTFALTLAGTNEDLSASGDLDVRASLAIAGAGPLATTIDGASLDRVLDLFAPSGTTMVSLTGMALANGRSTAVLSTSAGLGLRVATSVEVSATDVDVRDNVATLAFGGGIGIDNRGCFTGTRVRVLRNVDPASPGSARRWPRRRRPTRSRRPPASPPAPPGCRRSTAPRTSGPWHGSRSWRAVRPEFEGLAGAAGELRRGEADADGVRGVG